MFCDWKAQRWMFWKRSQFHMWIDIKAANAHNIFKDLLHFLKNLDVLNVE